MNAANQNTEFDPAAIAEDIGEKLAPVADTPTSLALVLGQLNMIQFHEDQEAEKWSKADAKGCTNLAHAHRLIVRGCKGRAAALDVAIRLVKERQDQLIKEISLVDLESLCPF